MYNTRIGTNGDGTSDDFERNIVAGYITKIRIVGGSGTIVAGNYLGTDITGTVGLGGNDGISLEAGATNTRIGTNADGVSDATEGNVIAGNTGFGVVISNTGTSNNTLTGNYIGVDKTGNQAGQRHRWSAHSGRRFFNTIGGTTPADRNVISGNLGSGVRITDSGTRHVQGNYIGTNAAGTAALGNITGIEVSDAPGALIGGTTSGAGNLISGNAGDGIYIHEAGASGTVIQGNLIGTNAAGTAAVGNGSRGILVRLGAERISVGGVTAGSRNLISGNVLSGIVFSHGDGDVVQGNYIGTDISGLKGIPNLQDGIEADVTTNLTIGGTVSGSGNVVSGNSNNPGNPALNTGVGISLSGASFTLVQGNLVGIGADGLTKVGNFFGVALASSPSNTIGGEVAEARNIISGNSFGGVAIGGNPAQNLSPNNVIEGNYIGTDSTGTKAVGNAYGVYIVNYADASTIGGTNAGAGNLISGNTNFAVVFGSGGPPTNNLVAGNKIGTDVTGKKALGNSLGVSIGSGTGNTIGGTAAGAGNLISASGGPGVQIGATPSIPCADNVVEGNLIGTDIDGTSALPNTMGVYIHDGATGNTIGGTAAGQGNTIAYNRGVGVLVVGDTTVDNPIRGNAIYRNTGLGIDLGGDGVSLNDLGDADGSPNHFQNFPLVTAATQLTGLTRIGGSLNSQPNQNFIIDFYASPVADVDPSQHGGAQTYLGSTVVTTYLEGNISFTFDYTGTIPPRNIVTATATDAQGNTSEFALNFINDHPPVAHIKVTSPDVSLDDVQVSEGTTLAFDASTSTDPDGDALTYTWFFDDGTTATGPTTSHTYNVAGQHSVLLLADDGFRGFDGVDGKSTDNLIITVNDARPLMAASDLVPSATVIEEGQTLTLTGSFTDPNPNHSSTISIDWGDGSPPIVLPLGAGVRTFSGGPHEYQDNPSTGSTFPITVTVTTSDNQTD